MLTCAPRLQLFQSPFRCCHHTIEGLAQTARELFPFIGVVAATPATGSDREGLDLLCRIIKSIHFLGKITELSPVIAFPDPKGQRSSDSKLQNSE